MADPDDSQEGCQEKWVFLSQMFILEALAQLQTQEEVDMCERGN